VTGTNQYSILSRHKHTFELGRTTLLIEPFLVEEAVTLLNDRSSKEDKNTKDSLDIVEAFGCLPLGIAQAAAYIRQTGLSYRGFLDRFYKQRQILSDSDLPKLWRYSKVFESENKSHGNETKNKKLGIWTTWEMSLSLLKEGECGSLKEEFLTLSAVMNGRNISQLVLEPIFERFERTEITDGHNYKQVILKSIFMSHSSKLDMDDWFHNFVTSASNLSLVEILSHDVKDISFSIHPLIIEWLWRRQTDELLHSFLRRAISTISVFLVKFRSPSQEVEYEVLSHVQKCLRLVEYHGLGDQVKLGAGDFYVEGAIIAEFLERNHREEDGEQILRSLVLKSNALLDDYEIGIDKNAHISLAKVLEKQGDLEKAMEHWSTILSSSTIKKPSVDVRIALKRTCQFYLRKATPEIARQRCLTVIETLLPYFQVQDLKEWIIFLKDIMTTFYRSLSNSLMKNSNKFNQHWFTMTASQVFQDQALQDTIPLAAAMTSQICFLVPNYILKSLMQYHTGLCEILRDRMGDALVAFQASLECLGSRPSADSGHSEDPLALYITVAVTVQLYLNYLCLDFDSFYEMYKGLCLSFRRLVPPSERSSASSPIDYLQKHPTLSNALGLFKKMTPLCGIIWIDDSLFTLVFEEGDNSSEPDGQAGSNISWAAVREISTELVATLMEESSSLAAIVEEGIRIRESLCGASDSELLKTKECLATYYFIRKGYSPSADVFLQIYQALTDAQCSEKMKMRDKAIRSRGSCLSRLGRLDEFNEMRERFSHIDWIAVEEEERTLMAETAVQLPQEITTEIVSQDELEAARWLFSN
jgi:hypothetical protein